MLFAGALLHRISSPCKASFESAVFVEKLPAVCCLYLNKPSVCLFLITLLMMVRARPAMHGSSLKVFQHHQPTNGEYRGRQRQHCPLMNSAKLAACNPRPCMDKFIHKLLMKRFLTTQQLFFQKQQLKNSEQKAARL